MPRKKKKKSTSRKIKGFSLLELIAVAAIIAVMAGFFLATYPASQRRARDTQRIADLEQYRNSLQLYANAQEDMSYPATGAAPLHQVCANNLLPNFSASCPQDPNPNTPNNYVYVSVDGGNDFYVYAQLENDPTPGDANKEYFVATSYGNSGNLSTKTAPGKSGTPPFK